MLKINPVGKHILVKKEDAEEMTAGGIVIPEVARQKEQTALVVGVGQSYLDQNGKLVDHDVKVGDRVLCGKYAGTEIKVHGEEMLFITADDVIAVVQKEA